MGQNKRYGDPLRALDPLAVPPPAPTVPKHVWVNLGKSRYPANDCPGLLIEWRRTTTLDGWEAFCTWALPDGSLHSSWVSAQQLRPLKDVT